MSIQGIKSSVKILLIGSIILLSIASIYMIIVFFILLFTGSLIEFNSALIAAIFGFILIILAIIFREIGINRAKIEEIIPNKKLDE